MRSGADSERQNPDILSQEDFMSDNEADVHRLDPLNAHPPRFWGHFDPSREDRSKS